DRPRLRSSLDARAQHVHERGRPVFVARDPIAAAPHARVIEWVSPSRGRLHHLLLLSPLAAAYATPTRVTAARSSGLAMLNTGSNAAATRSAWPVPPERGWRP